MTKRTKPEAPVVIHDLDEADAALADIAEFRRSLTLIETELNETIDAAKADAAELARPYHEQVTALGKALGAFAQHHKPELFAKRRSVELTHGRFGFQLSHELRTQPRLRWADVLERCEKLGLHEAIKVKKSVDKQVLRQLPEHRMTDLGCRLVDKDTFYYELDELELAETER